MSHDNSIFQVVLDLKYGENFDLFIDEFECVISDFINKDIRDISNENQWDSYLRTLLEKMFINFAFKRLIEHKKTDNIRRFVKRKLKSDEKNIEKLNKINSYLKNSFNLFLSEKSNMKSLMNDTSCPDFFDCTEIAGDNNTNIFMSDCISSVIKKDLNEEDFGMNSFKEKSIDFIWKIVCIEVEKNKKLKRLHDADDEKKQKRKKKQQTIYENFIEKNQKENYNVFSQKLFEEIELFDEEFILVELDRLDIKVSDIQRLNKSFWLNGNIIDFYMKMLTKFNTKIYALDTCFMNKLCFDKKSYDFHNVQYWPSSTLKNFESKLVLFHSYEKLFIPINISNCHWTFSYIDIEKKTVYYLNSLNNSNDDEDEEAGKILTNLKQWIYDYSKNLIDMKMVKNEMCKTYEMWMSAEWKTELLQKIPRQKDSYNCGIFCLLYAYYIADNIEFNNKVCSASDLDNIRNKITKSILTNVLEKLN